MKLSSYQELSFGLRKPHIGELVAEKMKPGQKYPDRKSFNITNSYT